MSDFIGRIAVPTVVNSGQTFPLTTQHPFGFSVERPVIVHRFGSLDAKQEQRYYAGIGPRKFTFKRPNLGWSEARQLKIFWENMQGPWQAFTYSVPNADGTFSNVLVTFEQTPLSFEYLRTAVQVGLNLVEVIDPVAIGTTYSAVTNYAVGALVSYAGTYYACIQAGAGHQPDASPTYWSLYAGYTVTSTCLRFPSPGPSGLSAALLNATQEIVPLVHIRPRESAVPDIWLSDRRVTLSGNSTVQTTMGWAASSQTYLPRLISMGEPGSDVLISQDIKGSADNVKFAFGNGDRIMTQLANDTDLKYAQIDLCLFHVNSGILLQLWKGVIQNFTTDGTPVFPVTCSDGFFQLMNQYPERQISRQCWKTFNDGVNCPYSTRGSGGSATSCDYYLESPNGCQAHGMCNTYNTHDGAISSGSHSLSSSSANFSPRFVGLPITVTNAGPSKTTLYSTIATFVDAHHVTLANAASTNTTGGTVTWGTGYFGGQQADPQGVNIKDNSTGFLGFGRNSVTATSIISETIWGLALPEIWCNSGGNPLFAFMCQPLMVDYRDESSFSDSLGIVGAGPIGGYTGSAVVTNADGYRYVVAPMLDGFAWQGFKVDGNLNVKQNTPGMGLRQPIGNDPANPCYDYFSLGDGTPQVWQPSNYAAGVALCEIRVSKSSTIQPSTPDQHQMTVPIDYGMWGWTWDASGNRTAVMGLINPFWIAVNMLLRAMGMYGDPSTGAGASSAAQQAMFVLPSLIVGDGSGAAEIAAAQVPAILGTGNETQFQFQGMISTAKPFRDWLRDVLACCLGFYAWEFGKLKLGCRINASAVDNYGIGNTLFQTLKLTPIQAAYEHMVLSFADVAYQYQANTAEYSDKSHAAYYGRAGSPLTTNVHSAGCASLSQALRIAATLTREEIGGVNATEWRDARAATWQTTLLGLGNEVGQVVSMTHPDIPGLHGKCNVTGTTVTWNAGDDWDDSLYKLTDGTVASSLLEKAALINGTQVTITAVAISTDGTEVNSLTVTPAPGNGTALPFQVITMSFRIQRWSLKKDWSVQLDGATVTDSMYDLDSGPKPMDVVPSGLPALFYPIPLGPAWAPYQIQAPSWDALFPSEYNFDSNQIYTALADGSVQTDLVITGKLPVNEFSATGAGGPVVGTITQSSTGGSLPANSTLRVSLCAIDSSGLPSAPSSIAIIGTSGTGTDSFTLSNIAWPAVAGLASYVLFVSTQDDLICAQASGTLTAVGGTSYTPGSITFSAPLSRSTWALPSPYVSKIRVKAKMGGHHGILGVSVDSVTTNTVVCSGLIDTSSTPPNLVGRVLSVIGRQNGSTPLLSVTITAYDTTTGTLTVSPHAVVTGQPAQSIQVNDDVVVRMKADAPNTSTPTQITDAGWINSQTAYLGLNSSEVGRILRVIAGTSRGETRKITGALTTGFSWDLPLLLDETSVFITEESTWLYTADSTTIDNADYQHQAVLTIGANNFINRSIVIAGFTVDNNGNESPDGDCPTREDFIYGYAGTHGGIQLSVNGVLSIRSDACPIFRPPDAITPSAITAEVKLAPTGSGSAITIHLNSVVGTAAPALWLSITIPANATFASDTSAAIAAAGPFPAGAKLTLDITSVGTGYPGSDLTVAIN